MYISKLILKIVKMLSYYDKHYEELTEDFKNFYLNLLGMW